MLCTAVARLHRRARHLTVRAKNTAVARLGLETLATASAIVEELTGVSGHGFRSLMIAVRTDDRGFQKHLHRSMRRDGRISLARPITASQSTGRDRSLFSSFQAELK